MALPGHSPGELSVDIRRSGAVEAPHSPEPFDR